MVVGTTMRTEFQKPTWMPLQAIEMQAVDHASTQLPNWAIAGHANMVPWRTSAAVFNDVTTITYSGSRKNNETLIRNA